MNGWEYVQKCQRELKKYLSKLEKTEEYTIKCRCEECEEQLSKTDVTLDIIEKLIIFLTITIPTPRESDEVWGPFLKEGDNDYYWEFLCRTMTDVEYNRVCHVTDILLRLHKVKV